MTIRKKFVCGNWKLHNTVKESEELVKGILEGLHELDRNELPDIAVAPVYTALAPVAGVLGEGPVALSAQNGYHEDSGAFTGEVSMGMLKDVGCKYVIVGHSERRGLFGETDEGVNRKAKKAIQAGLTPIICIGESLEQRESGETQGVVKRQLEGGLQGLSPQEAALCVLAYEPIWAIGTGKTATPEQAQEVHSFIRGVLSTLYDEALATGMVIQYGGSVKPENASELMAKEDVDGALVGGASLKADSFVAIVKAAMS